MKIMDIRQQQIYMKKRSCLKKNRFINVDNVLNDLIYHFYRVQSSLDQTFLNSILST